MNTQVSTIQTPFTLEQIAITLRQLPKQQIEELELMLDKKFQKTILERGKTAWSEYQQGQTLSLNQLQKEFSKNNVSN